MEKRIINNLNIMKNLSKTNVSIRLLLSLTFTKAVNYTKENKVDLSDDYVFKQIRLMGVI